MKFMITILYIFCAFNVNAYVLVCDKTTGEIKEGGEYDGGQFKDNPAYRIKHIKDSDPILKIRFEHLKYDKNTDTVSLKTQNEIDTVTNKKRKKEIIGEIRVLAAQYQEAVLLSKEGFDVSTETSTIRNRVAELKTEYQSLP